MTRIEEITAYLKKEYSPLSIITYGSFCDGTNDEFSDFDCMIIVNEKSRKHDDSTVAGVQLDCFIFTAEEVQNAASDPDAFLTVHDGVIICDTDAIAAKLKNTVREYAAAQAKTDEEEKQFIISWIRKTMKRAQKQDDEGSFRALAFLWESLTDYFILRDMFYFGSKKAAKYLKENDPWGYELYHNALTLRTNDAISAWAEHVCDI